MGTQKDMTLRVKGQLTIEIRKWDDGSYGIRAKDIESGNRPIDELKLSKGETVAYLGNLIGNILEKGSVRIFMKLTSYHEIK